jgi:uncharacterized cupin superfamily protein
VGRDRPNLYSREFDDSCSRDGFVSRRARLGRQAGARDIGASLYELPPGQAAWPYHAHLANEELLVVLSGRPSLRTPGGWRELAPGEVVTFPAGESGAHQVVNRTDETVRILMFSEMKAPEIALYPDSNKVGLFGRAPGSSGEGLELFLTREGETGYWEGERPPG